VLDDVISAVRQGEVRAVSHARAGLQLLFPGVAPLAEGRAVAGLAKVLTLAGIKAVLTNEPRRMAKGGVRLKRPDGYVRVALQAVDLGPSGKILRMLRGDRRRLGDRGTPGHNGGKQHREQNRTQSKFHHGYLP
jgi:hypothetical protein